MSLASWIDRNFVVRNRVGAEVQFACPKCGHPNFYFNLAKKVGHCHRDTCLFDPTMKEMIALVGYPPAEEGPSPFRDIEETPEAKEMELPSGSSPLIEVISPGKKVTRYPEVVEILQKKRHLTPDQIFKWDFHTDGRRIYVPVYHEGKLVTYIGRIIWGLEQPGDKRYKYPHGVNMMRYLFGWAEARYWETLVLVENTFNSIWLRDELNCITNFGSHLSNDQIELMTHAPNLREVIFLWDEGAEKRAAKAVRKLRNIRFHSTCCMIKGQPDDHSVEDLKRWVELSRESARKGLDYYECK